MFTLCDCRTDKYYNEKYLSEEDSLKIVGYDLGVEKGIYEFFNNIDRFKSELSEVGINCEDVDFDVLMYNPDELTDDMLSSVSDSTKQLITLKNTMFQWAELQRNGIIVEAIDNDKDAQLHKKEVDEDDRMNAVMRKHKQTENMQYII